MSILNKVRASVLICRASASLGRKDYLKAIEATVKARELDPNSNLFSAALSAILCTVYLGSNQYDKMIQEAKKCLQKYPGSSLYARLVIQGLHLKGAPLEEAVPYIQKYV